MLGMGPWHQRVDVLGEVTVGDADEEVAQVSIRLDAIHFAGADQAGEACPVPATLIVSSEESFLATAVMMTLCGFPAFRRRSAKDLKLGL